MISIARDKENDHSLPLAKWTASASSTFGRLYLDKVIDRRICLLTEILPSFLQVIRVS